MLIGKGYFILIMLFIQYTDSINNSTIQPCYLRLIQFYGYTSLTLTENGEMVSIEQPNISLSAYDKLHLSKEKKNKTEKNSKSLIRYFNIEKNGFLLYVKHFNMVQFIPNPFVILETSLF